VSQKHDATLTPTTKTHRCGLIEEACGARRPHLTVYCRTCKMWTAGKCHNCSRCAACRTLDLPGVP
jgi:hypothetical protein